MNKSQKFSIQSHRPNSRIFRSGPKPSLYSFDQGEGDENRISNDPSPERELKIVLDESFSKKKEKLSKKKTESKDLEESQLNPEISALTSSHTSSKNSKKRKSTDNKKGSQKKKKKPKISIFDGY